MTQTLCWQVRICQPCGGLRIQPRACVSLDGGSLSVRFVVFAILLRFSLVVFVVLRRGFYLYKEVCCRLARIASLRIPLLQFVHYAGNRLRVSRVDSKGLAEAFAHIFEHLRVEVHPCILTFVRAHEASFERERVYKIELSPHDDAAAGFLALLDCEVTVFEAKHIRNRLEEPTEIQKERLTEGTLFLCFGLGALADYCQT